MFKAIFDIPLSFLFALMDIFMLPSATYFFYLTSLFNHPDIIQQLILTSSFDDDYIHGISMGASLLGNHHAASVICK